MNSFDSIIEWRETKHERAAEYRAEMSPSGHETYQCIDVIKKYQEEKRSLKEALRIRSSADEYFRAIIFEWFEKIKWNRVRKDYKKCKRIVKAIRSMRLSTGNPPIYRDGRTDFWYDQSSKWIPAFVFKNLDIKFYPISFEVSTKEYFTMEQFEQRRNHWSYWTTTYLFREDSDETLVTFHFAHTTDFVDFRLRYDHDSVPEIAPLDE